MSRIKATFKLTPKQIAAMKPIADAFGDNQGGVLGQCWVIPTDGRYGQADFYFLTVEQYKIVDAAIRKA